MTKLQAKVLAFISQFIDKNGYSPSILEIADGVKSYTGNVHASLKRLDERGYLHKGRGWRNIRLIEGVSNARAA